jgi:hypothetical protein
VLTTVGTGRARLRGCPGFLSQAMIEATMSKTKTSETTTAKWRQALADYRFDLSAAGDKYGPIGLDDDWPPLDEKDRAERRKRMLDLANRSRDCAQGAIRLGLDPKPMAQIAAELDTALDDAEASIDGPETDPVWHAPTLVAEAKVLAESIDLHGEKPAELPADHGTDEAKAALHQQHVEQQRLAQTAFGAQVLTMLTDLHAKTPHAWRELEAFNGAGGSISRWTKTLSARQREKGYDYARKTLAEMAACGLLEKARRGGYRIAADGLRVVATETASVGHPR